MRAVRIACPRRLPLPAMTLSLELSRGGRNGPEYDRKSYWSVRGCCNAVRTAVGILSELASRRLTCHI